MTMQREIQQDIKKSNIHPRGAASDQMKMMHNYANMSLDDSSWRLLIVFPPSSFEAHLSEGSIIVGCKLIITWLSRSSANYQVED